MGIQAKTIIPEYVTRFSCIGSACEDTCCAGWKIDIDHKTYKKYRNLKNQELKAKISEALKRNRTSTSSETYAYMKLTDHSACPLLTEDKLCLIQKTVGESYLSTVCSTYPRVINVTKDSFEKSLTMSCPEAARLALLNPEKMNFVETYEPQSISRSIGRSISERDVNHVEHYFTSIRRFAIDLLQNREYLVSHRLVLLGLAMRKIQDHIDSNDAVSIPRILNLYSDAIHSGELKSAVTGIDTNLAIQVKLLKELIDERIIYTYSGPRFLECYTAFLEGINCTTESSDSAIEANYRLAFKEYYQPFFQDKEYIYEHYLVNYVFKNMFPLNQTSGVYDSYVTLTVSMTLIKLLLIGIAGYRKEQFGQDDVIKVIQSFTKAVEHNSTFLTHVVDLLKQDGFHTMTYMAILLIN